MPEATDEATALIVEARRYVHDSLAAHEDGNGLGTEWTWDEVSTIRDYVTAQFPGDEGVILYVAYCIEREFAKGHRCGVCGRTSKQNAAIGYDCAREC